VVVGVLECCVREWECVYVYMCVFHETECVWVRISITIYETSLAQLASAAAPNY